jgi:hypothetical protein
MVKKSVTIKQEPLFIETVEQEPVEQEPVEQEPVEPVEPEQVEPVEQEPEQVEPVEQEPEQVEQEPTPKKKPGRPVGSKSKEPGKPRAKRKIVERPAEESDEPENIEIPRALPGSRPIPSEAYDTSSAQMLQLLTAHTKQRQREKTELYKSWFR